MGKHGGTPSWRDKHVTPAAISPPGVARGRFVGGQKSGLAGCKPPPLFTHGASACSSQGRRQGEPRGASPRPSAPTYLPIAEPWQQCFAVSPVDIRESEDLLTEEELDLVQVYMDQPFQDWGSQREEKGQDKAWWEVDSIVSGSYDGNTFVRRVLDHMSSQDEPMGGNPPTYDDLFRGKTSDGPLGQQEPYPPGHHVHAEGAPRAQPRQGQSLDPYHQPLPPPHPYVADPGTTWTSRPPPVTGGTTRSPPGPADTS